MVKLVYLWSLKPSIEVRVLVRILFWNVGRVADGAGLENQ